MPRLRHFTARRAPVLFALLVGSILVAACGGSDGGIAPESEGAVVPDGPPSSGAGVVDLPGTLWWLDDREEHAVRVPADASSGSGSVPFELFSPVSWSTIADLTADFSVVPLPFSDERFLIVRDQCGSGDLFDPVKCIDVEDRNGELLSRFRVNTDVAKRHTWLSPNGDMVALFRHDDGILSPTSLEIYTVDGRLLAEDVGLKRRHLAWTADDRLLFRSVEGESFFFTEPGSTELRGQTTPALEGPITSWRIAPDGQRAVFGVLLPPEEGAGRGASEIWTMDFSDFSNIRYRRVASSAGAPDLELGNWYPGRWSPDGRHVLVRHTNDSALLDTAGVFGGSSTGRAVFSRMYAMPPVEGTTLMLSGGSARPAELVPLIRPFNARPSDRSPTDNWKPVVDLYWFD